MVILKAHTSQVHVINHVALGGIEVADEFLNEFATVLDGWLLQFRSIFIGLVVEAQLVVAEVKLPYVRW